jgi:hypothetical protein
MQTSSSNKFRFLSAIMVAIVIGLSSCSDDEKAAPDPTVRVPFLGKYQVKDQNSDESQYFSFTLDVRESSKGADKIDLKNFRYINSGLYATVSGNKFYIDQVMQDSDERVEIKGEGTLSNGKLTYKYKIVLKQSGEDPEVYENTAEATKVE